MPNLKQNSNIKPNSKDVVYLRNVKLTLSSGGGEVKILRGISLKIKNGEAVGIVGPSGGGKSTMMMVVAGIERVSSGTVRTAGIDLTALNEDELARFRGDNIGIVFQDFHLVPTMTALENVTIPLEFSGLPDAKDRAIHHLREVGLDHRLIHYPSQLSGGEQQRVALARAFAVQPKILLADEPTGNLDGETSDAVIDLLFKLHSSAGTTLLLVSHDPVLAKRCDRIITLVDGRIMESC